MEKKETFLNKKIQRDKNSKNQNFVVKFFWILNGLSDWKITQTEDQI